MPYTKTAQRFAVLLEKLPAEPATDRGNYLAFFLICFATFFSFAVFAGAFLVCFFEFWVLAMFLYLLRLLFGLELTDQLARGNKIPVFFKKRFG